MKNHLVSNESAVKWQAPAKINRFLHIVGRREDGYHLLQSVFVFLDIADELQISANDTGDINFDCDSSGLITDDNLCIQAAKLLQVKLAERQLGVVPGAKLGANIFLQKNIPVGGGLGGGSSDAATVFLVLNELWQAEFSLEQLADMGATLGADVPFFIRGAAAWVEGVGEKISALPMQKPKPVLLIMPALSVPTLSIFSDPDLIRDSKRIEGWQDMNLEQEIEGWRNDMEAVVFKRYPELKVLSDITSEIGNLRMSGSGSTFFIMLDENASEALLTDTETTLLANGYETKRAFTCSISGLHQQLQNTFH